MEHRNRLRPHPTGLDHARGRRQWYSPGVVSRRYRSQIAQSLHYFARPHAGIRREPLPGASAWTAEQLDPSAWDEQWSDDDLRAIEEALDASEATGTPTGELSREDVPLPSITAKFNRWRREIDQGRGFVVVRGLPVQAWSEHRAERFFWILGLHLGIPGAQNPSGDLLGHVRNDGAPTDGSVRQYRTTEFIDFHCDLADVVGLLCLQTAERGGQSMIASSVAVYNEVVRRRPELVDRLYRPVRLDTKGEGGIPFIPIEPCRYSDGRLRTFWHSGYFRSIERYDWADRLEPEESELLQLYSEILERPGFALHMDLRPGDIQLLSNHTIVHGRAAFEDGDGGERRRHLLRLWLSLPRPWTFRVRARAERSRLSMLARLARMRVWSRLNRR